MLAVQLVPRAAQQEVLVVGLVVRHANARVRIQGILERDLAFQDGADVRLQGLSIRPFQHVLARAFGHSRNEVVDAGLFDRLHGGGEMVAPVLDRVVDAHIRELVDDRPRARLVRELFAAGEPRLQDAVVLQPRLDEAVKLARVQEARAGRFHRRRRIDRDQVELLFGPAQEPAAVVDDDVDFRVLQDIPCVLEEIIEHVGDAGHEFHGRDVDVPA